MNRLLVVLLTILSKQSFTLAKNFTIEVESIPMERESFIRQMASGSMSTNFKTRDKLYAHFCLKQTTSVTLTDIRFSNDGDQDTVSINLDGQNLGSFSSVSNSNGGHNWNVYIYSGTIGSEQSLEPGRHVLEFSFATDFYGIELDSMELMIDDETLEREFFRCKPVCDDDINYSDIKARDDIPSAELIQASYETFCAKDRNINYQLFHESVTEYRLTASPPKYRTLLNDDMAENFACDDVSDVIWEFKDFSVVPMSPSQTKDSAQLSFGGTNTARDITVNFQFPVDESFTRLSDEDVGAVLTLKIKNPVPSFTATLSYSSRDGDQNNVSPSSTSGGTVTWNIPDFTWIEDSQNNVKVTLVVGAGDTVMGESFKLERRQKLADVTVTIYEDPNTKIQVVTEDQWWRAPEGIDVSRIDQSQVYQNITKITVSKVNRFTDGFNEIFQLSQDGLTGIKPMVPYGTESVPYGSDFIVGQFNGSEKRPYAGISTVVVDPFSLIIYIGYINNNTATLEINSKPVNTEIHVKNATFQKDREMYPIAGVRSTWASDGNADLDHVSANQNDPRPPIDDWKTLYGTAFAFFRQCVSLHNTQGPDFVLELKGNEDATST